MNITQHELLEALARAREQHAVPNENALTMREIAKVAGLSQYLLTRLMQELITTGEWECVKVIRTQITGQAMPTWGYRPKPS